LPKTVIFLKKSGIRSLKEKSISELKTLLKTKKNIQFGRGITRIITRTFTWKINKLENNKLTH
jgi:hypothetical protein